MQRESILADINLETRDTELLFLKWFLDHLTDKGRAGVIVPNGVLFGSGKADRKLRELLLTTCELQAVIALPSGVFKPYSGVGTAIFIFQKGKPTESVWFYELTADGYSLDDKRTPIEANDVLTSSQNGQRVRKARIAFAWGLRLSAITIGNSCRDATDRSGSRR